MLLIGHHLDISNKDLNYLYNRVLSIESNVVQIFSRSPRKICDPISQFLNVEEYKEQSSDIRTFIHAPYGTNLTKDPVDHCTRISLKQELAFGQKAGIVGIVVHPGSTIDLENYQNNMIKSLTKIITQNRDSTVKILIENNAKAGSKIFTLIGEIINFHTKIADDPILKYRVGFCIDTCHVFVTRNIIGKASMNMDRDLRTLKKYNVPIDLIHLNDSKSKTRDHHEIPFNGLLNKKDLINTINFAETNEIPMVIEMSRISDKDKKNSILKIRNKDY